MIIYNVSIPQSKYLTQISLVFEQKQDSISSTKSFSRTDKIQGEFFISKD